MFRWLKKNKGKERTNKKPNIPNDNPISICKSLKDNLEFINMRIGHSPDVVTRVFKIGHSGLDAAVIYIDGLADEKVINEQIMKPIMFELAKLNKDCNEKMQFNALKDTIITSTQAKIAKDMGDCILHILSGGTAFFVEKNDKALLLSTPGWETRGLDEPPSEPSVRGPREGFVETLKENIVRLRRRIRDPNFTVSAYKIGRRSNTDLAVVYIKGLTNQNIVDEIKRRIERIDIDMVQASGYIEQLIEDNFLSPFPQMFATERPDKAVGALMDGFVVILLDNTPFALIAPATFPMFMQTAEDYYERWIFASLIRILRAVLIFISLFLPALYVALISFHQNLIPTNLMFSIAANREGVPFPSLIEALIMEITLEILREAGVRLPRPIGQAVGIVGGLVIGEAAVKAGIVSPVMVIVVALTAISSFALPQYSMGISIRILRFVMMLSAGAFGLYGIMLCYIMISAHLIKLKSFGIDYLSPYAPYRFRDWKDFLIRAPIASMKQRPKMLNTEDPQREGY